jgi:8-oxo-dGTP pyrophosphatase MutT (NUDIX family)
MSLRPAATIVLLREMASTFELLMIRRNSKASAFADAFVFPGGVLEQDDASPATARVLTGLTEDEANRLLQLPMGGLSYWAAAVRECFEETGILFARDVQGKQLTPGRLALLAFKRNGVRSRELNFYDFLEQESLFVPASQMSYIAHWITPPVLERRFDTRFFLAVAPEGQSAVQDGSEIVDCVWLTPMEALERARRNEMTLRTATKQIVTDISRFDSLEAVLANARSATLTEQNH